MTADEQALVKAVTAAPADDVPRLVYADWLEENGRPERAEFIRVQCELAHVRIADVGGRERYDRLSGRYRELSAAYWQTWEREALAGVPVNRQLSVGFTRGMVGEVSCTAKYFLEHGERLVAQFPLERLTLTRLSVKSAKALATCPHFRQVAGLRFLVNTASPEDILAVLGHCPLDHLRTFAATDYVVNTTSARIARYTPIAFLLATSESLAGLKHIDLSAAQIGDDGGSALAASTILCSLECLDLMHNSLSEQVQAELRRRYGNALVLDYPDRQRFPVGRW